MDTTVTIQDTLVNAAFDVVERNLGCKGMAVQRMSPPSIIVNAETSGAAKGSRQVGCVAFRENVGDGVSGIKLVGGYGEIYKAAELLERENPGQFDYLRRSIGIIAKKVPGSHNKLHRA